MRLAFLHVDLPPEGEGGVSFQVDLLAREMAKRHELTLFTAARTKDERPFRVVQCGRMLRGSISKLFGVGLTFGRLDLRHFDVVHAHGDSWALHHPSVVRTFYGTAAAEALSATSTKRRVGQSIYYGLELVACMRAQYRTTIGAHATRFLPRIDRVIPCGVDTTVFYPGGERFEEPTILLVAGRLGGRKRGRLAIEAFRFVREKVANARMIIVSRDSVDEPGVECHAAVPPGELGELFRRSWVLCSASSYEGFGVPYAEALLSGLPIVTTKNPGAEEILAGTAGLVVPEYGLGPALVSALVQRPAIHDITAGGKADRYRIDRVADQFDEVYKLTAQDLRCARDGECLRGNSKGHEEPCPDATER